MVFKGTAVVQRTGSFNGSSGLDKKKLTDIGLVFQDMDSKTYWTVIGHWNGLMYYQSTSDTKLYRAATLDKSSFDQF